jgi:predicted protein tyrosine phosphatase
MPACHMYHPFRSGRIEREAYRPVMRVVVLSRAAIEAGAAHGADAVISIRSTTIEPEPALDQALAALGEGDGRLLRLRFDDIGMASYRHFIGPTAAQIAEAISFGRAVRQRVAAPQIVVHCEFGRSRSAAIALALLADRVGTGGEQDAVAELLALQVEVALHPNPLIVALAEAHLGLGQGRLDTALAEVSSRYVQWRDLWRAVEADPDRYWEIARSALDKRNTAPVPPIA